MAHGNSRRAHAYRLLVSSFDGSIIPEIVCVDEVFDLWVRYRIGCRRAGFENLTQVHHCLNMMQSQCR